MKVRNRRHTLCMSRFRDKIRRKRCRQNVCGACTGVSPKKTSPGLPRGKTPPMPCRPNYNLHMKAGGSPKFCFTASNFRTKFGRPAIRRFKSASLIRDVGLMSREGQKTTRTQQGLFSFQWILCGGGRDYFSSSSSSSNSSTEKCSYTSCSSSSSSMDSNSSSPFSSITERRIMMP